MAGFLFLWKYYVFKVQKSFEYFSLIYRKTELGHIFNIFLLFCSIKKIPINILKKKILSDIFYEFSSINLRYLFKEMSHSLSYTKPILIYLIIIISKCCL